MSTSQSRIHAELRAVCNYRSLLLARMALIFLLLPCSLFFFTTPLYLCAAFAAFPSIIRYGLESKNPQKYSQYMKRVHLPETMASFRFTYSKYQSEKICSFLIAMLLAVWQLFIPIQTMHGIPVGRIPALLLILYFVSRRLLYHYCHIKKHYDFMHVNI